MNDVALLETRAVSKYFGNVIALKDVSVSVAEGGRSTLPFAR